jgi:hypothetical protein
LVVKVDEPVKQTACVPLKVPALGSAVTVTVRVLLTAEQLPEAAIVYVIVAVPAATPVTTPVLAFTVAIPVALEVHVPPASPSVLKVEVPATQIA